MSLNATYTEQRYIWFMVGFFMVPEILNLILNGGVEHIPLGLRVGVTECVLS